MTMTGIMRTMKIKTKRGAWQVYLHWREGASFTCNDQFVYRRQVPKSVWRQARCFLTNPDRFGRQMFK